MLKSSKMKYGQKYYIKAEWYSNPLYCTYDVGRSLCLFDGNQQGLVGSIPLTTLVKLVNGIKLNDYKLLSEEEYLLWDVK